MLTSTEYREWLLEQIDSLTKWSQPEADLNVCQDAADIVRESGEIALRLGLPDSYRDCRVATNLLAIPVAKEILGRCLVACGTVTDAVTEEPKEVPKSACKLIYERAYRQFEVAEAALGSVTDKQAYDWFKTHERIEGDRTLLMPFETWCRYLREARRYYGTQKNSPRAGRAGRSIVSINDIENPYDDYDDDWN